MQWLNFLNITISYAPPWPMGWGSDQAPGLGYSGDRDFGSGIHHDLADIPELGDCDFIFRKTCAVEEFGVCCGSALGRLASVGLPALFFEVACACCLAPILEPSECRGNQEINGLNPGPQGLVK